MQALACENEQERTDMRTEQRKWTKLNGWDNKNSSVLAHSAGLVLIFAARELIADSTAANRVHAAYPGTKVVGCSTAGTISGTNVGDDFLAVTAIGFEKTNFRIAEVNLPAASDSAGARTILGIDENEQRLTFAGDIPQGVHARLMRANFDRLIEGAIQHQISRRSHARSDHRRQRG